MDAAALHHLPLLLGAAFVAGALNAVAGGGSFLTLPALVYAGVPALTANATGTAALLPGYLSSTWAYRHDIRTRRHASLPATVLASLGGGALGAGLLLLTPNATFRAIVPWLLLLATALFAAGPYLLAHLRRTQVAGTVATCAGVFAVSVYGGYFNGGLGIMLLALYGLLGHTDLNAMNGLKNLLSALLTTIAVALYALGGAILWGDAALMALAATAGGWVGAHYGRRLPPRWLRAGIVVTGLTMTVLFFRR